MYPYNQNPVSGIFVQHQVEELAKHYRVKVISTNFSFPHKVTTTLENDIEVTRIFFSVYKPYFFSSIVSYFLFALPVIRKIYRDWAPDIVHVHDCRHIPELLILRTWLNKLAQLQFVSLHNIRSHPEMLPNNRIKWLYKCTMGLAYRNWSGLFTVNERLRNWISPYLEDSKITVLGNAISPTVQCQSDIFDKLSVWLSKTRYKIISVGNLVPTKGFDILIEAVNILIKQGESIQLVIIGDGLERNKLISMIQVAGLQDIVFMTGSIENSIVRNIYPLFDAFVLPSYSETFGIVYIEAMFAGLPVIGTKGQGIDGIFTDQVECLLANPKDTANLVSRISFLMQNPEQAMKIAEAGKAKVRKDFMLPNLIQKVIDAYEK